MPVEVLPEVTIAWPKNYRRLCVDIDGVICEYNFPKIVRKFFGVDISLYALYAYDLADVLGIAPKLINIMFQEQVYGKPNFVPGAIETLKAWQNEGYEISIFSNRTKYMGSDGLVYWLNIWEIPFSNLTNGEYKYDFHIDDSPAKLMSTKSEVKLLFNQPWNEHCLNITGKLKRVKSWQEVRECVRITGS